MKRNLFLERVRQAPFKGRMTEAQERGTSAVLAAMDGLPTRHVAYALATAFHETAFTMQPIKERGGKAYFTRMYDVTGERPALAKRMGNTKAGDGPKYAGRGYVQLTWLANYRKASQKLGIDLVCNPDRAMEPELAALIMRHGMVEGWFTGKKLSDYLSDAKTDYRNARRIINGTDRADEIAGYALAFEAALRAGGYGKAAEKPTPLQEPAPAPPKPEPSTDATGKAEKPGETKPETLPASPVAAEKPKDVDAIIRQGTAAAAGVSAWTALFADADRWIVLGFIGAGTVICLYALYVRAWRK
jgi:putative chitinase